MRLWCLTVRHPRVRVSQGMSATRARFGVKDSTHQCREITRDNVSGDDRRIVVTLLDKATRLTSREPLDMLPRTEWQRVFAFLKGAGCMTCGTVDVRVASNDEIKDAISHALRDHHADRYAWSPGGGATPATPAPAEPTPAPAVESPADDVKPLRCVACGSFDRVRFVTVKGDEMTLCHRCAVDHANRENNGGPRTETPAPATPDAGAMDAFTSLVHGIATAAALTVVDGMPTPDVDAAAVQAIVDAAVADLRRPVVNVIEMPNGERREIPGQQHAMFDTLVRLSSIRMHAFLVGPPGTGKTTLAAQTADALNLAFSSISCYATMPASALWGFKNANGDLVRTEWRERYEHGGVFLFDEIDNGHAGTLAAVNQALANGECAFPDGMVKRHPDFVCIGAGNTYGNGATRAFMGRNALDGATRDRFKIVTVDIDERLEAEIAHAQNEDRAAVTSWIERVRRMRRNVAQHGLQVIVSPRATIDGARMLTVGFTPDEIAEMTVLDGLSADQRAKVTA